MSTNDNHNITELIQYLREEIPQIRNNLTKIERAIYGDAVNGVQGLIDYNKQTQSEMHKIDRRFENKVNQLEGSIDKNLLEVKHRISSLEKLKSQFRWVATGLATGASIGGASLWEFITRMK